MKNDYVFIMFDSTLDAMDFECAMLDAPFSGRLVPVPSSISASCGMCWMEKVSGKETLMDYIKENDLAYSDIVIMEY